VLIQGTSEAPRRDAIAPCAMRARSGSAVPACKGGGFVGWLRAITRICVMLEPDENARHRSDGEKNVALG